MPIARSSTLVLTLCIANLAGSQGAPTITLKPASATHPAEFSSIAAVRELGDGRVIVLDTTEKRLLVADFRAGTATQVGRTGDGPEEYRRPTAIFALPGDSTLVVDAVGRRWVLLAGDKPVATVTGQSPLMAGGGTVRGTDAAGHVVKSFTPTDLGRAIDQGDSLYLSRQLRSTAKGDTIARLRSPYGGAPGTAGKSTPQIMPRYVPGPTRKFMLAPIIGDAALTFPDGWTAVARVDPYRVDWIDPTGVTHTGKPLPIGATALDEKEKAFYLQRQSERDKHPAGPTSDITNWRADIPAFWGPNPLLAALGGAVVVERAETSRRPNATYDIVERTGVYRGQLSLGTNERLVGFGARFAYLAKVNADGIQHLQRHPWP